MGAMQMFEVKSDNKFKVCRKHGPIPMVARSKAWFYCRSLAGIADSNPAGGIDVCLLGMLCVVE